MRLLCCTTTQKALRYIVIPPLLIGKILSITGVSEPSGSSTNDLSAFSSSILWRGASLRYKHDDIYFDIVETPDAVVTKNRTIITSSVLGKIDVNCELSRAPDSPLSHQMTISRSWNIVAIPQQASPARPRLSLPLPLISSKCKCRSRCAHRSPSPTTVVRPSSQLLTTTNIPTSPLEGVVIELYLDSGMPDTGASDCGECTCSPRGARCAGPSPPPHNSRCHPFRLGTGPGSDAAGQLLGTFASGDAHPRTRRGSHSRCLRVHCLAC
ncbi:hypothetical protein H4582DRAFT_1341253 [Lactarius indigo]|nr:hypothetical protein H4582DRAFT_1341253 [Lactarius indigo]